MKKFDYSRIKDEALREYIQDLQDEINKQSILKCKFKFFDLSFTQAESNKKIPHNLTIVPDAVLQLSKTGSGDITYNYESFDKDALDITTTGACSVKLLVGKYGDENV